MLSTFMFKLSSTIENYKITTLNKEFWLKRYQNAYLMKINKTNVGTRKNLQTIVSKIYKKCILNIKQ